MISAKYKLTAWVEPDKVILRSDNFPEIRPELEEIFNARTTGSTCQLA